MSARESARARGSIQSSIDVLSEHVAVIDGEGATVTLQPGATDAALTPYHVERGKLIAKRCDLRAWR